VKRTYLVDTSLFKYIELLLSIDNKDNSLVLKKLRELKKITIGYLYKNSLRISENISKKKLTKGLVILLLSKRKPKNNKSLLN
jgi:hypothetical protein